MPALIQRGCVGILAKNWLMARGPRSSPATSLYDLGRVTFPLWASATHLCLERAAMSSPKGHSYSNFLRGHPANGRSPNPLFVLAGSPHSSTAGGRSTSLGPAHFSDITSWPPAHTTHHSHLLCPAFPPRGFCTGPSSAWNALPPRLCWAHSSSFRSKAMHPFLPCPSR